MEGAKQNGDKELWWECLRRRCELKRQTTSEKGSPLEPEFYAVMLAYETLQAELRRRSNYRAIRTWKMVENKGVKAVLEKWAKNKQKGNIFKVLMDHEAYDLTAEYAVLKYKTEFSPALRSQRAKENACQPCPSCSISSGSYSAASGWQSVG